MPTRETEEITRQIDRITFLEREDRRGEAAQGDRRFGHLLVALDGSTRSAHALEWALYMASKQRSKVAVIVVLPEKHPIHGTTLPAINQASARLWEEMANKEELVARKVLEDAAAECRQRDLEVETLLERGPVVKTIAAVARSRGCDLVLVGSHGRRGLQRFLLGSVAEGVRDHVEASVLIARNRPAPKNVLLAVDGSDASREAGRVVSAMMENHPAHVHMVHVVHSPVEGLEPEMREKWVQAAQDLRVPLMKHVRMPRGTWVHYDVHFGPPAEELLRIAKEDEADLVVLGSRGLSGIQSLVAGSVSRRVSHHATASVLIVK